MPFYIGLNISALKAVSSFMLQNINLKRPLSILFVVAALLNVLKSNVIYALLRTRVAESVPKSRLVRLCIGLRFCSAPRVGCCPRPNARLSANELRRCCGSPDVCSAERDSNQLTPTAVPPPPPTRRAIPSGRVAAHRLAVKGFPLSAVDRRATRTVNVTHARRIALFHIGRASGSCGRIH